MRALEDLPQVFKDSLENVDVVIRDEPTAEEAGMVDAAHRRMVMGLYQGVPLARRSHYYGMVMPDKITLFKALSKHYNEETGCGPNPTNLEEGNGNTQSE